MRMQVFLITVKVVTCTWGKHQLRSKLKTAFGKQLKKLTCLITHPPI